MKSSKELRIFHLLQNIACKGLLERREVLKITDHGLLQMLQNRQLIAEDIGFYYLTDMGEMELETAYKNRLTLEERYIVNKFFDTFQKYDIDLRAIVTGWQVKPDGKLNDHKDSIYDIEIVNRLLRLDKTFKNIIKKSPECVQIIVRHYKKRLTTAINQIKNGNYCAICGTDNDSYHMVWFELHYDLARTTGCMSEIMHGLFKRTEPGKTKQESGTTETGGIIAISGLMRKILSLSLKIAKVNSSVLLEGETGVGKEVVARYIHKNSNRCSKPLVAINCGALPEELFESEVFGYAPGAFTGARPKGKIGLIKSANGGTLFLDEIGELSLSNQVKMLRFLEDRRFTPIGSIQAEVADVRLIAATNQNLEEGVKQGLFRKDLYYRLNVISLTIPPLRKRPEDIAALTYHFLSEINKTYGFEKMLQAKILEILEQYHWPGNVRELRNVVERMAVLSNDNEVTPQDLPHQFLQPHELPSRINVQGIIPLRLARIEIDNILISKALQEAGTLRGAARLLKIDPSSLYRIINNNHQK